MNGNSYIKVVFFSVLTLAILGCGEQNRFGRITLDKSEYEKLVAGYSIENRPIEITLMGTGQKTTLFIATIHGDEWAGTPLLAELEKYLLVHRELLNGCKVAIIALANPDGFAAATRFNANGIDLNRNFAAFNRVDSERHGYEAFSEPESGTLQRIITELTPKKVITIHQPFACIDYDGPAEQLAEAMADRCPLEVNKLGAMEGSLGSFVGVDLNIPVITLELGKMDHTLPAQALWDEYGECILAAIEF
ncbi:MAG: DUF2817 domain-containing protein [Phycisphaerae bacterium]|nr:DUF2817 domain-containing protein [Phycisphaerae bacterium]